MTGAFAQVAPAFEVASIHPEAKPRNYLRFRTEDGRFTAEGTSLLALIRFAYDVENFQVRGGPDWIGDRDTQFYIQANLPDGAPDAQARAMLRSLLVERFQLKLHQETTNGEGYVLTRGNDVPTLKPPTATPETRGCAPYPTVCRGVTLTEFTHYLSGVVFNRTVVDRTLIDGVYDVTLKWRADDTHFNGNGGRGFFAGDDGEPSIFTAIHEQLGLKLEAQNVPITMIVVDSAQPASGN